MKALWLTWWIVFAGGVAPWAHAVEFDGGRYGQVRILVPDEPTRGVVLLFSDRGGWSEADDAALRSVAKSGALAVGIDTKQYMANFAAGQRACDQLVGDAEGLSRRLQRQYNESTYWFPILAGAGAGGTIAWVTLSQAPPNTFSGAISIDPSVELDGPRPLCGAPPTPVPKRDAYRYGPVANLSGFWTAGVTPQAQDSAVAALEALRRAGTPVQIESVDADPSSALQGLLESHLDLGGGNSLAALPLEELPTGTVSPTMAVVLSGDGGWRDLDKTIGQLLQRDGVPVLGWDCVRYFWHLKTPQQSAADLTLALRAYLSRWHAQSVALIGYSFGADVLPEIYGLLPSDLQRRVVLMTLLAPSERASWEIKVGGWFGGLPTGDGSTATAPALAALPHGLVQCFYGSEETDSVCPALGANGAEVIRTAGGHHFGNDYVALERQILDSLRRRQGAVGKSGA